MEHNNSFFVSSVKTVTILRYVILPDSIPLDTLLVDDAKRLPKVGGKLPGIEEVDPISQALCATFLEGVFMITSYSTLMIMISLPWWSLFNFSLTGNLATPHTVVKADNAAHGAGMYETWRKTHMGSIDKRPATFKAKIWSINSVFFCSCDVDNVYNKYIYIYIYKCIYIYLEPKWPLFWLEKALFWGLTLKNRGHLGSGYMYIFDTWYSN